MAAAIHPKWLAPSSMVPKREPVSEAERVAPTRCCRRCDEMRPLERFGWQRGQGGWRKCRWTCKDCHNAARQAKRAADPAVRARTNRQARESYRRQRERLAIDPAALAAYRSMQAVEQRRRRARRKMEQA